MKSQLAVMVAALVSTAALAQQPPADRGDLRSDPFSVLDADRDGAISKQEAQASAVVAQAFGQADANGDGKLTREEFGAAFTVKQPETGTQPAQPPR